MTVGTDLNTSLNQHSLPLKFVFYSYVRVLFDNTFCQIPVKVACNICDLRHSLHVISIFWTLEKKYLP